MVHRIVVGAVMVGALAFAPAAGAAVTASTVTSPANGTGFDVDLDDPGQITVTGTATADNPATDMVRIACTYSENADGSAAVLAPTAATGALTPTGVGTGTFSVQVSGDQFEYFTCRLRAVPSGGLPSDYRSFTGPVAHFSGRSTDPPNQPPALHDFYQDISGPLGYWDGGSTSACFVYSTYTLDPATLGYGQLFDCAGVAGGDPTGTRASLRVDGRDGFLPAEASSYTAITGDEPITGFVRRLDPASGDVQLTASEPTVHCADGSTTYPPTCPAWADAGLSDRATTVGDHGGRLVRHTDVWTNSGSGARQLDVWYRVSVANTAAQWRFPGETAYAPHADGDHSGAGGAIPTPPAGPASVLVADDPAQAGYLQPRGSVTWSSAPSEIRFTASSQLYLHYVRTVPARGAAAVSLAFATDGSQANVDALSAGARAGLRPTVAITGPANGVRVGTAAVRVTGTATDDGPVSVSVNGHSAALAANRTWSVVVPLRPGANTLVATARDSDGNTAQAQRTVTRATVSPPPPPRPVTPSNPVMPSNRFTLTLKKPKAGDKSLTVTLTVPGAGAIRAKLRALLKRPPRRVTLAKAKKTATTAGKVRLRLRLTKKARALLRRHHALNARLSVTYTPTGGTARAKTKSVRLHR
jgi:glucodextranase-like protein